LKPFTGNGDVSIEVKYSCAGRKTANNQSINLSLSLLEGNEDRKMMESKFNRKLSE
jgi:hypothetical protein